MWSPRSRAGYSTGARRGAAAAASWIFRGDAPPPRPRRGYSAVAASPRPMVSFAGHRGVAATDDFLRWSPRRRRDRWFPSPLNAFGEPRRSDEHRARVDEFLHGFGVLAGRVLVDRKGKPGARLARVQREQVLDGDGDCVQRTATFSLFRLFVADARRRRGLLSVERLDREDLRVVRVDLPQAPGDTVRGATVIKVRRGVAATRFLFPLGDGTRRAARARSARSPFR